MDSTNQNEDDQTTFSHKLENPHEYYPYAIERMKQNDTKSMKPTKTEIKSL